MIKEHLARKDYKLDTFKATMICEGDYIMAGVDNPTEELIISAWQFIIDNGTVWNLQGSFGRTAETLINKGICREVK